MELLKKEAAKLGLRLSAKQVFNFETYYRELADWNRRINLTSVGEYEPVQITHFLDSLTVAPYLEPKPSGRIRVLDVGTGAGFPGLPLKILLQDSLELCLLEATGKKAVFLRALVEKLGLTGVEIVNERAETAAHRPDHRARYDYVLARAVAELPVLLELTLPFCRTGGRAILQKKGDIKNEIDMAEAALRALGGRIAGIEKIDLEVFPEPRYLVLVEKTQATDDRYPRRPGVPARRPILD